MIKNTWRSELTKDEDLIVQIQEVTFDPIYHSAMTILEYYG